LRNQPVNRGEQPADRIGFSDVETPKMDGFEATRAIRAREAQGA
jgi:CheY-like chemotaxis protein